MIQVFQQLQGLANGDKFSILNRMVNGELKMEEVKKEDLGKKRMGTVRKEMMHLAQKRAWDECCGAYPNHDSDMVLDQFLGKLVH